MPTRADSFGRRRKSAAVEEECRSVAHPRVDHASEHDRMVSSVQDLVKRTVQPCGRPAQNRGAGISPRPVDIVETALRRFAGTSSRDVSLLPRQYVHGEVRPGHESVVRRRRMTDAHQNERRIQRHRRKGIHRESERLACVITACHDCDACGVGAHDLAKVGLNVFWTFHLSLLSVGAALAFAFEDLQGSAVTYRRPRA